ncbi:uncharacterized protein LOC144638478 [Oculina patagonica]
MSFLFQPITLLIGTRHIFNILRERRRDAKKEYFRGQHSFDRAKKRLEFQSFLWAILNVLQRIVYISLVITVLYGLTEVKARRCSETLRDQPCVVEGSIPLKLRCDRKAGKFFKIISLSVQYRSGIWTELVEPQALANTECRDSRDLDINFQYYCSVSAKSLCPYADRMRKVKIEYFCWEIDPDLLNGFSTDLGGWVK